MAHLDMAGLGADGPADDEPGKEIPKRGIKVELAVLVQEHRGNGGGGDLGEARDVEKSVRGDGQGRLIVGKSAEGFLENGAAVGEDTEGASREGSGGDGILKHAAGGGERRGGGWVSGRGRGK